MKTLLIRNSMKLYFGIIALLAASTGFAESVTQEAAPDPTIYEQLGMTSTQLFLVMMIFTILLVIFAIVSAVSLKNATNFWMKQKGGPGAKMILLLVFLGLTGTSFGAEPLENPTFEIPFSNEAFWIWITFDLFLVFFILFMLNTMNSLVKNVVPMKKRKPFWAKWSTALTDATPIDSEASILLDHDYDGIKELDNNLPPWWKYGFYLTIVWAVVYFSYYMFFGGPLQEEQYLTSMAEGEAEVAQYIADHPELVTAENVELMTDEKSLAEGRTIFTERCVVCHMEGGRGGVGPNLTDENWIYDGDIRGVFTTVSEGAQNGMIAWKTQLNAREIQSVSSYLLQLEPILPPVGQEPKGDNIFPR
jgi:cytochrome c oxidase cbb3-type subunit III